MYVRTCQKSYDRALITRNLWKSQRYNRLKFALSIFCISLYIARILFIFSLAWRFHGRWDQRGVKCKWNVNVRWRHLSVLNLKHVGKKLSGYWLKLLRNLHCRQSVKRGPVVNLCCVPSVIFDPNVTIPCALKNIPSLRKRTIKASECMISILCQILFLEIKNIVGWLKREQEWNVKIKVRTYVRTIVEPHRGHLIEERRVDSWEPENWRLLRYQSVDSSLDDMLVGACHADSELIHYGHSINHGSRICLLAGGYLEKTKVDVWFIWYLLNVEARIDSHRYPFKSYRINITNCTSFDYPISPF